MEFINTIENAGSLMTDSESSSSPTSNPAGIQAREELAKIMSDPAHPMHAGYMRNEKAVQDHIGAIYKKAYPETAPPDTPAAPTPLRAPEQDNTPSLEDRVAQTQVEEMLRGTFGESYDSEMHNMRIAASHLFTSPESHQVLADFSQLITGLGPLAEVRSIRFLAEIGALIKQHNQQGGRR